MKKFKVFAMAAAALTLGLTSCNKNEGGSPEGDAGKAYINLSFVNSTRAVGDATDVADSNLDNATIFVLAGNAVINQHYVTTFTAGATGDLATTNKATGVFVVANAGDITNVTISDLAKLQAVVANMDATPATPGATASQVATKVMMTSGSVVSLGTFTGTPLKATAAVGLQFVGAKLVVQFDQASAGSNLNANIGDWTFKTYVTCANGVVPFLGTIAQRSVLGATLYSGIAATGTTTATYLMDASTAVNTPNHYYVFGNDAATTATVVGIEAIHTATSTKRYFPIHFNATDAANTIVPGNVYIVTLKLKGDFTVPTAPGVTDPNEEVNPAFIDLTITPAAWNPRITVNKDI